MEEIKPYPKNVAGDFIVNDGQCIQCCAPEAEAPDLMGNDGTSCYFKKQPSSPEELERALMATQVSCTGAVRYCGKDPMVLRRLAELEEESRRLAEESRIKAQEESQRRIAKLKQNHGLQ
jgi:hypothetical protein